MSGWRLVWKLNITYLLVIGLCTLAVGVSALRQVESSYKDAAVRELTQKAKLIAPDLAEAVRQDPASLEHLTRTLAAAGGMRVTVMKPGERHVPVVADSEEDPSKMDDHGKRPEVEQALLGDVGMVTRYSSTLRRQMVYVAVPVEENGHTVVIVRTSLALTDIDEAAGSITRGILVGAAVIAALALGLAVLISRRISHPLEQMKRGAERFAQGDFSRRVTLTDTEELGGLAEALNSMAEQLDERIATITRQQQELQSVLSSMTEGVLAVDGEERLIILNQAAADMLGAEIADPRGRMLAEVIRNVDIQRFVQDVWTSRRPQDQEVLVRAEPDRQIEFHGRLIRDEYDLQIGVLVVLVDVTRLRRLENVRRDFVANVSHELRTPVTSIRGFVETLREGAVDDPQKARQFLDIVARHAERLGDIIEDLLSLSRIEQSTEEARIDMARSEIAKVLRDAVADCRAQAAERDIVINVACADNLYADVNAPLVEQAVCNLLDNAVKYSDTGRQVAVEAAAEGEYLVVRVRDQGWGIPSEHLPRLFERFYRVDKGRSRKLGGTGLGLSIVKHIVQAHGGSVAVESEPGRGTLFTLRFPLTHYGAPDTA